MRSLSIIAALSVALSVFVAAPAPAQEPGPLRLTLTDPNFQPIPIAIPAFIAQNPEAQAYADQIGRVVANDLLGTGLFREIPREAYISQITSFDSPVQYADWKAINTSGLVTGAVAMGADGRITVKFRLFDIYSGTPLGEGLQFGGSVDSWRRMAHKVADQIYTRITGEGPYFDSRVVFVSESGPKDARQKRLAIMDYDGANVQYLTDSASIVLAPRFSPDGGRVLYTSYEGGAPAIYMIDVATVTRQRVQTGDGTISFSPRFSRDGSRMIYSLSQGGNTDLWIQDIGGGAPQQLTNTPAIETSPSFSPDGSQIVFESDRSGTQQLYIMPTAGGEPKRISFGPGRYGTPVWSPRGDYIAFTYQDGQFHIGVMRVDGSEEKLLTTAFIDEGPSWAPNGRVVMFSRETSGASGEASLYAMDISGFRHPQRIPTETGGSDPSWGPLLP